MLKTGNGYVAQNEIDDTTIMHSEYRNNLEARNPPSTLVTNVIDSYRISRLLKLITKVTEYITPSSGK